MSVNKWKIKANALLDDPSIRTYLNSLNSIILAVLKGRLRALTVNVENAIRRCWASQLLSS